MAFALWPGKQADECPRATRTVHRLVDNDQGRWTEDYRQSSGGYEIVFSGVLFCLFGLWLDRKVGTLPWLAVSGAVIGFVGGVANVYYRYKNDIERIESAQSRVRRSDRA